MSTFIVGQDELLQEGVPEEYTMLVGQFAGGQIKPGGSEPQSPVQHQEVKASPPVPDGISKTLPQDEKAELKKSYCYLIKEKMPNKGYVFFKQALKGGMKGMCVSRDPPAKVRTKFELLNNTPVIWLSNTPSDQSMQPKNLEKFAFALFEFMGKDEEALVLIDCIEYLITNNNFNTVLKLVQSIKDKVAVNKAILIITTNPAALESQQISLLEREMDIVL